MDQFKRSFLTLNQFENHVLNKNETFFGILSCNAMFPFNKVNNTELMLLNFDLAFENIFQIPIVNHILLVSSTPLQTD